MVFMLLFLDSCCLSHLAHWTFSRTREETEVETDTCNNTTSLGGTPLLNVLLTCSLVFVTICAHLRGFPWLLATHHLIWTFPSVTGNLDLYQLYSSHIYQIFSVFLRIQSLLSPLPTSCPDSSMMVGTPNMLIAHYCPMATNWLGWVMITMIHSRQSHTLQICSPLVLWVQFPISNLWWYLLFTAPTTVDIFYGMLVLIMIPFSPGTSHPFTGSGG